MSTTDIERLGELREDEKTSRVELDDDSQDGAARAMIIVRGRFLGRTLSIPDAGMVIGRSEECELTVGSSRDGTSRRHARLFYADGELQVEDLGSTNGLLINHLRSRASVLLPGDLLQVGETLFKIVGDGDEIRYHEAMYKMAVRDALTGLFNRTHLEATLDREIQRAKRYRNPLSLLLMDLDHFKDVNDAHGHVVGDAVLMQLGELLLGCLRSHDLPCRYGGEEFVVVLPETGGAGALILAERCRATLAEHRFLVDGTEVALTVSVGVATLEREPTADSLIRAADRALYIAKNNGRNQVAVAHGDEEQTERRQFLR